MQSVVAKALSKQAAAGEEEEEEMVDDETAEKLDDFAQLDDSNLTPDELDKKKYSQLFKGLTFLLSREVCARFADDFFEEMHGVNFCRGESTKCL